MLVLLAAIVGLAAAVGPAAAGQEQEPAPEEGGPAAPAAAGGLDPAPEDGPGPAAKQAPPTGQTSPTGQAPPTGQADLWARLEELESELEALRGDLVKTRAIAETREAVVEGTSTLTFELDVLTGGSAFKNDNQIDITVPLSQGTVADRSRDGKLAATVSLYRFDVSATEQGMAVAPGKIDARLLWGDSYLQISQAPELLLDKAPAFTSRSESVRTNTVTAAGGLALGREAGGSALELRIGTFNDDARLNYKNRYGFGLDVDQRIVRRLLSIEGGVTYGLQFGYIRDRDINFTSRDLGFSLKPKLTLPGFARGIELSAGADFMLPYEPIGEAYGELQLDARIDARLNLSAQAALDDGTTDRSRLEANFYGIPQLGIYDAQLIVVELPGDDGFLPVLGFDAMVVLLDLLGRSVDGVGLEVGGGLQATLGPSKLTPFVRSSYATLGGEVGLGIGVKDKLLDDRVELQAEYRSEDINHYAGDMGTLAFTCKMTY